MARKVVAIRLEEDLSNQLKIYAAQNKTTVQNLLESHVVDLLNKAAQEALKREKGK